MAESHVSLQKLRRLGNKIKLRELSSRFLAWKDLADFDRSVNNVEEALDGIGEIFDRHPSERTKEDIACLMPLLDQVKFYNKLFPEAKQVAAQYLQLAIISDSVELPRNIEDQSCLFSNISGRVSAVMCDLQDPTLHSIVKEAIEIIKERLKEPQNLHKFTSSMTNYGSEEQVDELAESEASETESCEEATPSEVTAAIVAIGEDIKHVNRALKKKLASDLWHTVIDLVNAHSKAQMLSGSVAARQEREGLTTPGSGASGATDEAQLLEPAPSAAAPVVPPNPELQRLTRKNTIKAAHTDENKEGGELDLLGGIRASNASMSHASGPAVAAFVTGESFTGRNLDLLVELGQVESGMEVARKTIAAVSASNTMTALVYITKAVFKRILRIQTEMSVRRNVDACCRIPALRHSPLRELFKLSRYLVVHRFPQGSTILTQGREIPSIYLLIEGEVDIWMEVSNPPNEKEMMKLSRLASTMTLDQSLARPKQQLTRSQIANTPIKWRVWLARRGPGSVLGDDSLRERRMAISVFATTDVVALGVNPQRFTMCLDALTLRLFHRLRPQTNAMDQFDDSVLSLKQRREAVARQRDTMQGAIMNQVMSNAYVDKSEKSPEINGKPSWRSGASLEPSPPIKLEASAPGSVSESGTAEKVAAGKRPPAATITLLRQMTTKVESVPGPKSKAFLNLPTNLPPRARELLANMPLPVGLTMDAFNDVTMSDSARKLMEIVGRVEEERRQTGWAAAAAAAMVAMTNIDGRSNADAQSAMELSYTELVEAACLASVQLTLLPGQPEGPLDVPATLIDEVWSAWSDATHHAGITLARWGAMHFYLMLPLDSGPPDPTYKPGVRIMVDCLVKMKDAFDSLVRRSNVPHHMFTAAVVLGELFTTFNGGRFLTHVAGNAYQALRLITPQMEKLTPWGGIVVADGPALALRSSYGLASRGGAFLVTGPITPPFTPAVELVAGEMQGSAAQVVARITTHGPAPASSMLSVRSMHMGGQGASICVDHEFMGLQGRSSPTQRSNSRNPSPSRGSPPRGSVAREPVMSTTARPGRESGGVAEQVPIIRTQQKKVTEYHTLARRHAATHSPIRSHDGFRSPRVSISSNVPPAHPWDMASITPLNMSQSLPEEMGVLQAQPPWSPTSPVPTGQKSAMRASFAAPILPSTTFTVSTATDAGTTVHSASHAPPSPVKGLNSHALRHLSSLQPPPPYTALTEKRYAVRKRSTMQIRQELIKEVRDSQMRGNIVLAEHPSFTTRALEHDGAPRSRVNSHAGLPSIGHYSSHNLSTHSASSIPIQIPSSSNPNHLGAEVLEIKDPEQDLPKSAPATTSLRLVSKKRAMFREELEDDKQGAEEIAKRDEEGPESGWRKSGLRGSKMKLPPVDLGLHSSGPLSPHGPTSPRVTTFATEEGEGKKDGGRSGGMSRIGTAERAKSSEFLDGSPSFGSPPQAGNPISRGQSGRSSRPASVRSLRIQSSGQGRVMSAAKSVKSNKAPKPSSAGMEMKRSKPMSAAAFAAAAPQHLSAMSLSACNVNKLPKLDHLSYLSHLAASFNRMEGISSDCVTSLPPTLQALYLSYCHLKSLPEEMGSHLLSLTDLDLSHNELRELPYSFSGLQALTSLMAGHNHLSEFPEQLSHCYRLELLSLPHNSILDIPYSFFDGLAALKTLDLSSNELFSIPVTLSNLVNLQSLSLAQNELSELPSEILTSLTALTELDLSSNQLCLWPKMIEDPGDEDLSDLMPDPDATASSNPLSPLRLTPSTHHRLSASNLSTPTMAHTPNLIKFPSLTLAPSMGPGPLSEASIITPAYSMDIGPSISQAPSMGPTLTLPSHIGGGQPSPLSRAPSMGLLPLLSLHSPTRVPSTPGTPQLEFFSAMNMTSPNMPRLSHRLSIAQSESAPTGDMSGEEEEGGEKRQKPKPVLPSLIRLRLARNELTVIPRWIPGQVRELYLDHNLITHVHPWLPRQLSKLQVLDLQTNKLEFLCSELTQMTQLSMLCVVDNIVTEPNRMLSGSGFQPTTASAAFLLDWFNRLKLRRRADLMPRPL